MGSTRGESGGRSGSDGIEIDGTDGTSKSIGAASEPTENERRSSSVSVVVAVMVCRVMFG